jgi:hypothetical protein
MEDFKRAIVPAQKAVDLTDKPQEGWVQLVLALYLQQDQYANAVPLLKKLIKHGSGQEDLLATVVVGLRADGGLQEVAGGRTARIQRWHPDRGHRYPAPRGSAVVQRCTVQVWADAGRGGSEEAREGGFQLYEKQANCWIAARDFAKSIDPLNRAAEMSSNGDLFVRLGEVQVQRNEWAGAVTALQNGLRKGGLKDPGNAQVLLGIAQYNQKNYAGAKDAFTRARNFDKHRKMADGYLQLIQGADRLKRGWMPTIKA